MYTTNFINEAMQAVSDYVINPYSRKLIMQIICILRPKTVEDIVAAFIDKMDYDNLMEYNHGCTDYEYTYHIGLRQSMRDFAEPSNSTPGSWTNYLSDDDLPF